MRKYIIYLRASDDLNISNIELRLILYGYFTPILSFIPNYEYIYANSYFKNI